MRVTYIKHSAFLVEWEDVACLFDWADGKLPEIDQYKKIFIFVSHAHPDHFSPELFARCKSLPHRTYILSSDVKTVPPSGDTAPVIRMGPEERRFFTGRKKGVMSVTTLRSTDQGVAFVVNYAGRTVYHAGDLHWWAWPDDMPDAERAMREGFSSEISKLRGLPLDAAFLPLDPRLEDNYWLGFDALMRMADVKTAFPMHMWEQYDTVGRLLSSDHAKEYADRIARVERPGQVFDC